MEDIENKALKNPNAMGSNAMGSNAKLSSDNFILNKDGNIIGVKTTTPKKNNDSVMGYF